MKLCFIGSGMERERVSCKGIEVRAVAREVRSYFDTLVFGGSNLGLMEAFASAFLECGGRVIGIVPNWLHLEGAVFEASELLRCDSLAERKRLMFEGTDAVLCYPGGIGTWDELLDLLARQVGGEACPPIYIYNWERYYSPFLLQIEVAVETGFIHQEHLRAICPFGSVEALSGMLRDWARDKAHGISTTRSVRGRARGNAQHGGEVV